MEKEKSVCFTGHRVISAEDRPVVMSRLYSLMARFIGEGYEYFICGGAVGFDTLAAESVIGFKERFPHIKLVLALPCRDQTSKWESIDDLASYKEILGQADSVVYMQDFYTDGCMHQRNRWMVDHAAVCVAFLKQRRGGTLYTYNYAKKAGVELYNLNDDFENLKFI